MADEMRNDTPREPTEGVEYLRAVRDQETRCYAETGHAISGFGRNLPILEQHLGTVLSFFERAACCWWGCAQGDHVVESLAGRVYGLACGSHRLMQAGRYDESLLLIRALGEVTNLLTLFAMNATALVSWRAADEKTQRHDFSPVKVRLALENAQISIPMDQSRYELLCGLTAHPTPSTKPGMHNPSGRSVLGGHVQIAGIVVVLNELARVLGCAAVAAASLLDLPIEPKLRMRAEGADLLKASGPLTLQTIGNVLSEYRKTYGA